MAAYKDYIKDLQRALADWDLKKRDAEAAENARRAANLAVLNKAVAVLVTDVGFSEEKALQIVKDTPMGRAYFGDKST
jgi:AmiR/NasT family two-component response regulator